METRYILERKIVTIWSDGEVTIESISFSEVDKGAGKGTNTLVEQEKNGMVGSSRIIQALEVISNTFEYAKNASNINEDKMNRIVNESISKAASTLGVSVSTIRDKVTRQIGITHRQFVHLLFLYFKSKGLDTRLTQKLKEYSSKSSFNADHRLIEVRFTQFKTYWEV